jgi:hypothetical protein
MSILFLFAFYSIKRFDSGNFKLTMCPISNDSHGVAENEFYWSLKQIISPFDITLQSNLSLTINFTDKFRFGRNIKMTKNCFTRI